MGELIDIDINMIDDPEVILHPDKEADSLRELADSIKAQGLLQPIVVRKTGDRYKLVIGHRRTQAARTFGIPTLKARVVEMEPKEALIATATENIQRLDQCPIKEAELYETLRDKYKYPLGDIGKKFGKSGSYVQQRLDLLDLPIELQNMTKSKRLKLGVAVALKNVPELQDKLLLAGDFMQRGTPVDMAKAQIQSFLEYKKIMLEAPVEDVVERAVQEPLTDCHACGQKKKFSVTKVYVLCNECWQSAVYLREKEKREKDKQ